MQPQQVNCIVILHRIRSYCSCNVSLVALIVFPSQLSTSGINQGPAQCGQTKLQHRYFCCILQFKGNDKGSIWIKIHLWLQLMEIPMEVTHEYLDHRVFSLPSSGLICKTHQKKFLNSLLVSLKTMSSPRLSIIRSQHKEPKGVFK